MINDVKCWDNYWGEDNFYHLTDQRAGLFRRLITNLPIKSILEVGCSNGYNLAAISRMGDYDLTGIDIAPRAIKNADKSIANFMVGDAFNLPFQDNSFDLVLCCSFFNCFFDNHIPELIAEVSRVCRKYMLVIDYHGDLESSASLALVTWQKRNYDNLFPGFSLIKSYRNVAEISICMSVWLFKRK